MTIQNGQTPNADEVLNAIGSNFNDTAQMIFNADYIGFDSRLSISGMPLLKNVFYDTFTSSSDVDRANTTMYYDIANDLWFVSDTIDDTNDGSVDANLWNTSVSGVGSVTEGTSSNPETANMNLFADSSGTSGTSTVIATLDQINAPNLKDEDSSLICSVNAIKSGSPSGTGTSTIKMTDGSNFVTLATVSSGPSLSDNLFLYTFNIDVSAEEVEVFKDYVSQGTIDISSLTGSDWNILFESVVSWTSNATPDMSTRVLYINYIIASTGTGDLVWDSGSTSETVTNLIPIINESKSANASATYLLAADGSTFESITPQEIHRPAATGTTLKIKVTGDPNKQTDVFDFYRITEEAIKFNYY